MEPPGYFPGEEPRLRALLDGYLSSLAASLKAQPFAAGVRTLLLAGGYGRGEGGIFRATETAEAQLYNDLEFYAVLASDQPAPPVEEWCASQAHRGDELLGIEVEFKVLPEGQLLAGQPSMFFYDLLSAHRLVAGSAGFLESLPAPLRDAALIPEHEAARLLFNRGSGLFYSSVALRDGDARVANGFVERNHAKVWLALGDAVLAMNGQYHFSCVERHRRMGGSLLLTPPDWPLVAEWHARGVEFKLHPRHRQPAPAELQERQRDLTEVWLRTFLWVESNRLGTSFPSAESYGAHGGRLFPHTSAPRNLALHLRDRIKRGAALRGWLDYPRGALQRALVLLLKPVPDLPGAARWLGCASGLAEIHAHYERWWKHYN